MRANSYFQIWGYDSMKRVCPTLSLLPFLGSRIWRWWLVWCPHVDNGIEVSWWRWLTSKFEWVWSLFWFFFSCITTPKLSRWNQQLFYYISWFCGSVIWTALLASSALHDFDWVSCVIFCRWLDLNRESKMPSLTWLASRRWCKRGLEN